LELFPDIVRTNSVRKESSTLPSGAGEKSRVIPERKGPSWILARDEDATC